MKHVYAAKVSELPEGGKKKISVDDKDILIIRLEGAFYAVDNTCPHMGGSLYDGKLEGSLITCPKHGSVFDIKNGKVHQPGKILMFKVNPDALKTFLVSIEEGNIMVDIE